VTFKDHFSERATEYARFRPRYPAALFRALADLAPGRRLAWDCGTGNGQAAVALAGHFERVAATDASPERLAHAEAHPRVTCRRAPESQSDLEDASVLKDLAGYLDTWSSVRRYRQVAGTDPVRPLVRELAPLWRDPGRSRTLRWPLTGRVGKHQASAPGRTRT
jgi:hypothetical protein